MKAHDLYLSQAELEDTLIYLMMVAALADALSGAEVPEEAEKAGKSTHYVKGGGHSKAGLIPTKKVRVHPKYGVQLATYYVKPERAPAEQPVSHMRIHAIKKEAQKQLNESIDRLIEYYSAREAYYKSDDAERADVFILSMLKMGKTGVGAEVDKILRAAGLREEKPSVSSAHNHKFFNFLLAHGLSPNISPLHFQLIQKAYETVNLGYNTLKSNQTKYENFWKSVEAETSTFRYGDRIKNKEAAEALALLAIVRPKLSDIHDVINGMINGREMAYRGYLMSTVAFWATHTNKDISHYEKPLKEALAAHREASRAWQGVLWGEVQELYWRANALVRLSKEKGVNAVEVGKTITVKELQAKVNELAAQELGVPQFDVYEALKRQREKMHKKQEKAFRAKVKLIKAMAAEFHDKDVADAVIALADATLSAIRKEKLWSTKVEKARAQGQEIKPEWEQKLIALRRYRAHLKDVVGDVATAMLANALTGAEMVKGDVIRGAIKELWQRASSPESFKWKKDWQATYCAKLSQVVDELLGRDRQEEREKFADLIKLYPNAPHEAIQFAVRVSTKGSTYRRLIDILRSIKAGGAGIALKAVHYSDIFSAF